MFLYEGDVSKGMKGMMSILYLFLMVFESAMVAMYLVEALVFYFKFFF